MPSADDSRSYAYQSAPDANPNVSTGDRAPFANAAASGLSAPTSRSPLRGTRFASRRNASRTASRSS